MEEQLKHGANFTPKDDTVILLKNVAGDTAPFDWNIGIDVTRITGEIPTKNQGQSYSCGGQAASYLSEITERLNGDDFSEKSAKFIYAPIAAPGGGSSDVSIMNRLTKVGDSEEIFCPSYYYVDGNKSCDESFMVRTSDISENAIRSAGLNKLGTPLYVKRNLEDIAKAVREHGGVIIGIIGKNNGTWLSADPVVPSDNVEPWYHWMYVGKAFIRNGKNAIGAKQSWGEPVGENGWQYFGTEWMPHLFTAFAFAKFAPAPGFKHSFNTNLKLGDKGTEVKALQDALKLEAVFPKDQLSTGYFGQITLQAVKAFQTKYGIKPVLGNVFNLTRAKLNSIYS